MQRIGDIQLATWRDESHLRGGQTAVFGATLVGCACASALLASWLPLQVSIVTVFLFAGPHNWFEFRYFLLRLPVRFGKSRNFFIAAFAGIGILTAAYAALPLLYSLNYQGNWSTALAAWNTLMLIWIGLLIWLRGKQKVGADWFGAIPAVLAIAAVNWLRPELFSLVLVFLHPLIALWFFDRHLRRTRREWLKTYHRCLLLLPLLIGFMVWQLSGQTSLPDDNGLFWRITQHAGAGILPGVSTHLLVSVHVFLEMLHYGVWIIALPLIVSSTKRQPAASRRIWDLRSIPLARHPRGFPRLIGLALLLGVVAALMLWSAFSMDYSTTRDIYFTVAIAHVLAEAPFLLRMI